MSDIHQQRQVAESFGVDAERYDRTRPSYPEAVIKRIVEAAPGPAFLDVGTGTGIAARQLQAAGADVLGLDVDERMAEQARRRGLEVEVAKFEDWDPRGRRFDAVVAATTWHWIDPALGAAKAAEILKNQAIVALMWNVGEPPAELKSVFAANSARIFPGMPNPWASTVPMVEAYQAIPDRAVAGLNQIGAFAQPEQWRTDWELTYTRDDWLDLILTHGGLAAHITPEQADELRTATAAAIDAHGGTVTMHYSTLTVLAKRA
ncbi:class I SAM-dependent methyltransferase [Paractinoplanes rhizophilus]|uniref:Class I SAM-dependent methyltransferase n=1 Tax=Paractinoplanes rhizophilus TaxID=1416877 RepID=A0ABW2I3R9_9ACTN